MKSYKFTKLLLMMAIILGIGTVAVAFECPDEGDQKAGIAVGDEAPKWENLKGTDDESHSLADMEDVDVIVQVFTCNGCPVAKAYEQRLIELQKAYGDKGVRVVAINVNNSKGEDLDAMKERAEKQEFNFVYVDDPSQESPKQYGAKVTPHVFVLDKDRKVAYIGAFDDNMDAKKVEKNYVRDAVDALLDGQTIEVTTTKAQGCGIKWDKK